MDDFGVKYVGKEHATHLKDTLEEHYEISTDWEGTKYIGITLDWDYNGRKVHLSMPGYVKKALDKFQHNKPKKAKNQPYPHKPVQYGEKLQYAKGEDTSNKVDRKDEKLIHEAT